MDEKPKNNYIFPDFLGKWMSKVDLKTQYEATMLSMSFMMLGLIVSAVYLLLYIDSFQMWYKIFLVINMVAGLIFMSSNLVTTFQQYKSYAEALEFQEELK